MMPMPQNQKQLTGKKHSPADQAYYPVSVRECMYWPEPEVQAKPKPGSGGRKGGKGRGSSSKKGWYKDR